MQGLYFVGAFSLPAVLRNTIQLHQNRFRTHIVTLRTLNIAMLSYCTSVLVLLVIGSEDDVSEKQEAVRMACAEILYRVVCVVAASMLRNACEVILGNANQVPPAPPHDLPPLPPHDLPPAPPHNLPPAPAHDLPPAPAYDPPPASPHLLNGSGFPHITHIYEDEEFVTRPKYRMEEIRLLNRESFVYPFQHLFGDTPRVVVAMETNPKCGSDELVTLRSGNKHDLFIRRKQ